jgi:PEP-CTERM/exosortase A-associated glycosyltransferase
VRILHVMNDTIPLVGGYTIRSRCIVTHQQRVGMEPFVISSLRQGFSHTEREKFDGITYFRTRWPETDILKKIPILNLLKELYLFYARIRQVSEEILPDIIHAHSPILCAIPALFVARKLRIPIVYEIRAFWEDAALASKKIKKNSLRYQLIRILETAICQRVDRIVAISKAMKADLAARGILKERLFVVPNGVDGISFEPKTKNLALAAQLGLADKIVIGYLGSFFDFEGIDNLIKAFEILHKREKNVALLLIGGGEKEQAIRTQISRLCGPKVILIGKIPPEKAPDYYSLMDMVVYPRKSTRITEITTPLKPLEAMASGKPLVCSAVGGLKELVGKGNALFFTPENEKDLFRCCQQLIHKPSLGKQLAMVGKNRALGKRNWFYLVEKYSKVYECLK